MRQRFLSIWSAVRMSALLFLAGGSGLAPREACAQIDNTGSQARQQYSGIDAGLEAYRAAEERRQAQIRQQLQTNDSLRFWGGVPTSRGDVLYYRYTSPIYGPGYRVTTTYSRRPSRAGYWNGLDPYWGERYQSSYYAPVVGYNSYLAPADPVGAYYSNPVRQPIGQRQVQTGPNRWESYPIYSPELPSDDSALTPVDSPLLENTPYAPKNTANKPIMTPWAPDELPAPAVPSSRSGPREF